MKLTNQEALNARQGFALLAIAPENKGRAHFDIEVAYPMLIAKRKLETIGADITAAQKDLTEQHGKRDEAGRLVQRQTAQGQETEFLPEALLAFQAAWAALLAQTQDYDGPTFTKAQFAGRTVDPDALFLLGPLFTVDP